MINYKVEFHASNFSEKRKVEVYNSMNTKILTLKNKNNKLVKLLNILLLFKIPNTYHIYKKKILVVKYVKKGRYIRLFESFNNKEKFEIGQTSKESRKIFTYGEIQLVAEGSLSMKIFLRNNQIGYLKKVDSNESLKETKEIFNLALVSENEPVHVIVLIFFNEIYYSR